MDRGETKDASTLDAGRQTLESIAFATGGREAVAALPPMRFSAGPHGQVHPLGRAVPKEGPVARAKRAFRLAMRRIDQGD